MTSAPEAAEIAAKGVIGGRGPIKSNTGHPEGFVAEAVGWVSGSQKRFFRRKPPKTGDFGRSAIILKIFCRKPLISRAFVVSW